MRGFSLLAGILVLIPSLVSDPVVGDEIDLSKLPAAAQGEVDFAEQIRPIFKAKCYSCHGPDAAEGGLRLDLKQAALDGGDDGPVIVPGKSIESKLLHLVAELEEGARMPPVDEGTPLSKDEIALVRKWIDDGAKWPDGIDVAANETSDHWAFQPMEPVAPPQVEQESWVKNDIDRFILARLEAEGVRPSPPAERSTLIRRVYLDLVGLPPSPEAVQAFLSDTRSDAYERLVDELLASPQYGERWARRWLDVARYADSDGFEKDRPRPHAWRWRDWVIRALNEDMPFDEFTTAQIAGDLLPDASTRDKVATGFHRNTLINREGGTDPEEDRVKRTVDRTNTLGEVWLGLTVGCAQCHSHKYDPLTQREYYQLYAFFNSLTEPDIPAPLPEQVEVYRRKKADFDREHARYVQAIDAYAKNELPQAQAAWEASLGGEPAVWTTLAPEQMRSKHGAKLSAEKDGSILASGKNAASDVYTVAARSDLTGITGVRLEVLPHKSLPKNGPGRSKNGNFVLAEFRVEARPANGDGQSAAVKLTRPQADFSQDSWPVSAAVDGDTAQGWAVSPEFGKRHVAVFETAENIGGKGSTLLTFTLDHSYANDPHNLGRFRISVTTAPRPLSLDLMPDAVAKVLATEPEKRSKEQRKALTEYYRSIDPELAKLRKAEQAHAKQAPEDPGKNVRGQVIAEMPKLRETKILIRGDFLSPGSKVQRDTPGVLPPLEPRGKQADRLDLARWLIDPANPLTPRVTVNRIWQRYFGRGIVPTVNDFGTQGDPPSHPKLLDWLALEFRKNDWSLKALHRLIVTSATYRQSSAARPELRERDPYNRLLARQNRLRVEAEIIRDVALDAAGLLHHEVGGPSVRPPQPPGIDKLGYAGQVRWKTSTGKDKYRRGLYTFFQRTVPYPMLMTFDAPDSNTSCTRRERSNTPLQSLTLWNDQVFFECARALGRRIVSKSPANQSATSPRDARIRHAFRICLAREPSPEEFEVIAELYDRQLKLAQQNPKAAAELVGPAEKPAGIDTAELAAWVMVGRTLMNLDEFITRE